MGIIGVGVDILHTPRIASLVVRRSPTKFAKRILSLSELREWETLYPRTSSAPTPVAESSLGVVAGEKWFRFLTVRWAIKEAAYKALFPVYKPTWKDLTVSKPLPDGGKPSLTFGGSTGVKLHVSVSHDGGYTVANVLAEH